MKQIFVLSITIFTITAALAQFPVLSPKATVTQQIGTTTIQVHYERPAARGRKIFGALVPYDQLWRAGAGPSTKVNFSNPVVINKTVIPAGVYSLFAITGKTEWTIILNKDTSLYGDSGYSPTKDIVRVTSPVKPSARFYESFSIDIDVIPNNAEIYLSWANTQVSFTVKTGIDQKTEEFIKRTLLTKKSTTADEYAIGAEYLFYLNAHSDWAMILIDYAIKLDSSQQWYSRLKRDLQKGTLATSMK